MVGRLAVPSPGAATAPPTPGAPIDAVDPPRDQATARDRAGALRLRHLLVLLLAAHAGAMDALGFLALEVFTSVQTGNMVLAGVGAATDEWRQVFHAGTSVACFAVGCLVGCRVAGIPQTDDGLWPAPISRALMVQVGVMSVFAVGWWVTGADPGPTATLLIIVANAFGMGIQSAAIQRFGTGGLSTTYLTGMLTVTMVRIASTGMSERVRDNLQILGALVIGAVVGGLLIEYAAWAAPLAQIASVLTVVAVARWRLERLPAAGTPAPGAS